MPVLDYTIKHAGSNIGVISLSLSLPFSTSDNYLLQGEEEPNMVHHVTGIEESIHVQCQGQCLLLNS